MPVPWYDVELHDEHDRQITAANVPGEICIRPRAPHIMIERYWGADEYTIQQFRNFVKSSVSGVKAEVFEEHREKDGTLNFYSMRLTASPAAEPESP